MKKQLVNSFALSPATFLLFFYCALCFFNTANAQPQLNYSPYIQNLSLPLDVTNANDGSGRLFIVEQKGVVKIFKNGSLLSKPFLDISNIVSYSDSLKGMWSIAFSPNYKTNAYFFVYFTAKNNSTVVVRYRTSKKNPDSAIANSGVILFSFPGKNFGGPKFGNLHFGKDGYLYISVSDGSNPGFTTNYAQNGQLFYGKMLRVNTDVIAAPYYSIPPDNPFVNDPNVLDEIWHSGIRNAWRWSFDRLTGDIWIPDVGDEKWEEVNFKTPAQSPASNFGFPCYEANESFITAGCLGINNYTPPVFSYPHDSSFGGQVIIGGFVYRGLAYPALQGYYICSDYGTLNAWKIIPNGSGGWNVSIQNGVPARVAGYGEGEDGELYAASLDGVVYRVQTTASIAASISPDKLKITGKERN